MTNLVRLDNVDHQSLRLARRYSAELGHSVNQMLLVPSEFEEAQREFPILFRRTPEGLFQSVALLGLDLGENLFLGESVWETRYIPASIRREPFFLGDPQDEQDAKLEIFIDLDDPRVGETDGTPLFLPQGGNSPILREAISALRTVHDGLSEARSMFTALLELELIQPLDVQIQLGDGLTYRIPDVFSISTEQLSALSGEGLDQLHRSGFLTHAIFARSSLKNINRLVEHKSLRLANG